MKKIILSDLSSRERISAISALEEVIMKHGIMLDSQSFSDFFIRFRLEYKLVGFITALQKIMHVSDVDGVNGSNSEAVVVMLNVSFSHAHGNLQHLFPRVPG